MAPTPTPSPSPGPSPSGGGGGLSPDAQSALDAILSGQGAGVVTPNDPDAVAGVRIIETGRKGREGHVPEIMKQSKANLRIRDTLELKRWEKALLDAGKIKPGKYDYGTLVDLWEAYVKESSAWVARGKPMSPYEILNMDADISGSRKKTGTDSTSSNTQTSTSVDLTDPTTARGIIDQAYQSATGQAPTNAQREDFLAMLNDAERRHPKTSQSTQSTTTTSTTGPGRPDDTKSNTTSSGTSSGGVNPQQLAQDQAMQDPGYGAYQASTTYANALFEALRSPV